MLARAQFSIISIWVVFTSLQYHLASSTVTYSQDDNEDIIWNGCESEAMMRIYSTFTVNKPMLCSKRLPDYLDGVKPQRTEVPYFVQAIKKKSPGDFLITVNAKPARSSVETRTHNRDLNFQSVLISSQTPNGSDVGQFYIREDGMKDHYDLGYCCGESRNMPNFYKYHSEIGHLSLAVSWNSLNLKGLVIFNVTVVQNSKTYWNLPQYGITLD
ncbi:unnamed protein product [Allacma fusca]|uniref:Reelin domain-containing protein n=1 Tax=Allacma fusca TaxID=39272 RepID=A0A8J2JL47_9HEXA|nr:unnamed protein product [Allacma fusca]